MASETVGEALQRASLHLREAGIEGARTEAEIMLAHLLGSDRLRLCLEGDRELPARAGASFRAAVARRRQGEPLAYITGVKEFYGLKFAVNRHVLVPRPETELLVETAVEWIRAQGRPAGEGIYGIDLGTGCGNLAVTLASLLPQARFWACDLSAAVLRVAARNAAAHGVAGRIRWCRGSYFQALDALKPLPAFNLVVANPPYLTAAELDALPETIKHYEPRLALDGGSDGLRGYRLILAQLSRRLRVPALVAFEIGAGQAEAVTALCRATNLFYSVEVRRDYQGWPRVIRGLAQPFPG